MVNIIQEHVDLSSNRATTERNYQITKRTKRDRGFAT